MLGIRLYQNHQAHRDALYSEYNIPSVFSLGGTRLLDYSPAGISNPIVLVIPSLINKYTILDIEPKHSLLQFLSDKNLRPLLIDWGEPSKEEISFSMSDYVTERLCKVVDFLEQKYPNVPVHVLGYCLGGTLSAALALLKPNSIKSLSLLAAPWDFHADSAEDSSVVETRALFLKQLLMSSMNRDVVVPTETVNSIFTMGNPLHSFGKFTKFSEMPQDSEEAVRFVLTEDWLNDGVPLTLPAARECFIDWYKHNYCYKNKWNINGVCINPENIKQPVLIITGKKDKIVPEKSAIAVSDKAKHISVDTGHIGLLAGQNARENTWEPLVRNGKWIMEN